MSHPDGAGAANDDTRGASGQSAAVRLARTYAGKDWIAAVAKAAVMSRGEVERHFQSSRQLPAKIEAAVGEIDLHLTPPAQGAGDHVFAAVTNDTDAAMEVDAEAGVNALPGPQPKPADSGSLHEMRQKPQGD